MNGQRDRHGQPVDTAWRIHTTLMDWTGKVDAKASFALSLESAALTALAALSRNHTGPSFSGGSWPAALLYWVGVGLLVAAIATSITVVVPRLDGRHSTTDWPAGFVYFGHLRHWTVDNLADALRLQDPLPVVSRQLIAMSRIAWRKHRLVQISLLAATAGAAMASTARIIA